MCSWMLSAAHAGHFAVKAQGSEMLQINCALPAAKRPHAQIQTAIGGRASVTGSLRTAKTS